MRTTSTMTTIGATALDEIKAAHEMQSKTGADWRTCLRAIRVGVDVIRVLRIREQLRPLVAAHEAARGAPAPGEAGKLRVLDDALKGGEP